MRNGLVDAWRNSSWEASQNQSENVYFSLVKTAVFWSWSSGKMLSWSVDKKACYGSGWVSKSDAFSFFFFGEFVTFVEVFDPVSFKLLYFVFF